MYRLNRVMRCVLCLILILCTFLSSMLFSVSAANYYTFGGLSNTVVVEDNSAKYTVDIPFYRMYVFDENLVAYKIDQGDFYTFFPDHYYKVSLCSEKFLVSDFPVDYIQSIFLLSPSGAAYNADFDGVTYDVSFCIQFRDANRNFITNVRYPANFSSGLYKVTLIPEDIPANAVYFDFTITLDNFFVHTSSDSSDYCFWLDKFSVTSTVERSGIFSRTVSLYGDTTNSLIDQFIFTDDNYNCRPIYISVVEDGFTAYELPGNKPDQLYRWYYNDTGVFNGINVVVDGSTVYLKPGDERIFDSTNIQMYCDAEFSTGDNFITSINNFVSGIGDFFAGDPFGSLLQAVTNFREAVSGFFSGLVDSVGNFFSSIPDLMAPVIAPIENWIDSVVTDVGGFFSSIPDLMAPVIAPIENWIDSVVTDVGGFFSSIPDLIKPVISPIENWIDSVSTNISNWGSSIVDALGNPSWISDLFEIVSDNFIVDAFRGLVDFMRSVIDFFTVPETFDDSEDSNFWNIITGFFDPGDGGLWGWFDDWEFLDGLLVFYDTVSSFLSIIPREVLYLIVFGFGMPFGLAVIKIFLR